MDPVRLGMRAVIQFVIPAKAGIQLPCSTVSKKKRDPSFRGGDELCLGEAMRSLVLISILLLAACAPRVTQPAPAPAPTPVVRPPSGVLIGLTASELGARFGQPTFQVREGGGTKLQWSENGCVLDAYLYPPEGGRGVDRVMHVDARNPSGVDLNIDTCLALLAR
jgi:hypothetical protein